MKYNADLHVHIALPERELSDKQIKDKLMAYKKAGVTYLRDGGDAFGISRRAKKIAEEVGIDFRTPIFAIYKEGHYGSLLGKSYKDFDEFKALVDEAEESGADFIKLILSGIADFSEYGALLDGDAEDTITAAEIKKMVNYIHKKDLAVMAHVNGPKAIKAAIKAGVDTLEHGLFIDDEGIDMLASSATVWVPTITPIAAFIDSEKENAVAKKIATQHVENIKTAWRYGAMLGLGTDAGAKYVDHKNAIDTEYEFLRLIVDNKEFDAHLETSFELVKWKF